MMTALTRPLFGLSGPLGGFLLIATGAPALAQSAPLEADLIVRNALVTTLDPTQPEAEAFSVQGGKFQAVGSEAAILAYKGDSTRVIDAGARRVIPGLNDSHLHATRAGRFYALELRWDGVPSLQVGLEMIEKQAKRTPDGQWVRVIGGWSPYQFSERRMPTIAELNRAAPDTPTFVLFLYSQGFLNKAAVEELGLTSDTPSPDGARYEFIDGGAILHAEPNPGLLYRTIGSLPGLSAEEQSVSARHFYRELNTFGVTSAIDAGGGGHSFPKDYAASRALAESGELPVRVSYYLFPQNKGAEREEFGSWMRRFALYENLHRVLHGGYALQGGGEFLVWSAGDFENFMADRPRLKDRENWRKELAAVTGMLVDRQWPLRIHATYGESIDQILDVFGDVRKAKGRFAPRWAIDHAETAGSAQLERIRSMGGGIAVQNRMAFAGEFFLERYGEEAASEAPPLREIMDLGIPLGAGTDATRVSSYNPWQSLHWLITGKTVGGTVLASKENRLSRHEALGLWTHGSAWFSQEEHVKGRIKPGQLADFALLDVDLFEVPVDAIPRIRSVLTAVGGKVVFGQGDFANDIVALPPIQPDWSPVAEFGGVWQVKD